MRFDMERNRSAFAWSRKGDVYLTLKKYEALNLREEVWGCLTLEIE